MGIEPDYITDGEWGKCLTLREMWNEEYAEVVREYGVSEIVVHGHQFSESGLSVLCEFREQLRAITIFSSKDILKPIECLTELKSLDIGSYAKQEPINFASFPRLSRCLLDWSPAVENFYEASNIQELALSEAPESSVERIVKLRSLNSLSLLSCNVRSLEPLECQVGLKKLRLTRLTRLENNEFLKHLRQLEELWVQRSSGFGCLRSLANLAHLKKLVIEDCGPFESFEPISHLRQLEWLVIIGSKARPLDGDFTYLERLPLLQYFMRD